MKTLCRKGDGRITLPLLPANAANAVQQKQMKRYES